MTLYILRAEGKLGFRIKFLGTTTYIQLSMSVYKFTITENIDCGKRSFCGLTVFAVCEHSSQILPLLSHKSFSRPHWRSESTPDNATLQWKGRLIFEKAKHCFAFFNRKQIKHCFADPVFINKIELPAVFQRILWKAPAKFFWQLHRQLFYDLLTILCPSATFLLFFHNPAPQRIIG